MRSYRTRGLVLIRFLAITVPEAPVHPGRDLEAIQGPAPARAQGTIGTALQP